MPLPNHAAPPVLSAHVRNTSGVQRHAESYEKWATATGACSGDDFIEGVKQAYKGLGVTVDRLVRASKPKFANQLAPFPRIFRAVASMTRNAIFGTLVSSPILDTLPLDSEFKSRLVVAVKAEGKGRLNVFQIAHPNDYIVDAQFFWFEGFIPMESCRSFNPLRIAITFFRNFCTLCIPRSAKAFVMVQLLVVTPPQRFHGYFDLFYDRITQHETENERIALANVMASKSPFNAIVNAFDRIHRYEFDGPLAAYEIGLPPDTKDKILAKKKIMRLYLSKDDEWTIADMVNLEEVYDVEVRQ